MKRLTTEWVSKAEADMATVGALSKAKPALHDVVCFHCQQAAEKYLKAMMQESGLPVPRIHSLDQLLLLLLPVDATLGPLRRGLKKLSRYAVEYRYPGASANARQVKAALRLALRVREAIRQRLGLDKRTKPAR
jgi:HEPN domain-containing protein